MTENFVTLFDSLYLPQGLCLYYSLSRNSKNFILWIICMDEITFEFLKKVSLPNIKPIKIKDLESEKLLNIKKERTKVEYCWTLTPFSIDFLFMQNENLNRVTYVDADIYFLKDPKDLFLELEKSKKNVLITKHSFNPNSDNSHLSGTYCVQFITFCKGKGRLVLKDWKEKCLDWCYSKCEANKFGDQKYLEEWESKFPNYIHILEKESYAMGPWNSQRYPYSDAIFYHFHGLKIIDKKSLFYGLYNIPKPTLNNIYKVYAKELKFVFRLMETNSLEPKAQIKFINLCKLISKNFLLKVYNKLNIFERFFNKFIRI